MITRIYRVIITCKLAVLYEFDMDFEDVWNDQPLPQSEYLEHTAYSRTFESVQDVRRPTSCSSSKKALITSVDAERDIRVESKLCYRRFRSPSGGIKPLSNHDTRNNLSTRFDKQVRDRRPALALPSPVLKSTTTMSNR